MYWEYLGLPGTPASADVDALAKWVQWAMQEIEAGISGSSVYVTDSGEVHMGANEDLIRYNLSQFWNAKDAVIAALPEAGKRQVYRLDMLAHGCLDAVDQGKIYSESPGYWAFWKAYLFGGTPPRDVSAYSTEAVQASQDAASAASAAGLPTLATYFTQEAASVDQAVANANAFWAQPGVLNVAGVPWYVWAALAVGGGLLLSGRL